MSILFEIGALALAVIILYVLFKIVKELVHLLINSVIAVIALFLINSIFGLGIAINIFSILIVALAGFPGLILVLILHFFGLAF